MLLSLYWRCSWWRNPFIQWWTRWKESHHQRQWTPATSRRKCGMRQTAENHRLGMWIVPRWQAPAKDSVVAGPWTPVISDSVRGMPVQVSRQARGKGQHLPLQPWAQQVTHSSRPSTRWVKLAERGNQASNLPPTCKAWNHLLTRPVQTSRIA